MIENFRKLRVINVPHMDAEESAYNYVFKYRLQEKAVPWECSGWKFCRFCGRQRSWFSPLCFCQSSNLLPFACTSLARSDTSVAPSNRIDTEPKTGLEFPQECDGQELLGLGVRYIWDGSHQPPLTTDYVTRRTICHSKEVMSTNFTCSYRCSNHCCMACVCKNDSHLLPVFCKFWLREKRLFGLKTIKVYAYGECFTAAMAVAHSRAGRSCTTLDTVNYLLPHHLCTTYSLPPPSSCAKCPTILHILHIDGAFVQLEECFPVPFQACTQIQRA